MKELIMTDNKQCYQLVYNIHGHFNSHSMVRLVLYTLKIYTVLHCIPVCIGIESWYRQEDPVILGTGYWAAFLISF